MNAKKIHAKFGFATYDFFRIIESALNFCEIATYRARLIKSDEGDLYLPFFIEDIFTDQQKTAALKNLEGLFLTDSYERDGVYYVSFRRPESGTRKLKNVKVKTPRPQIFIDLETLYEAFLKKNDQRKDALFGDRWAQNRAALKHIYAALKGEARKWLGEDANINDLDACIYKLFGSILVNYHSLPNYLKGFELISIGKNVNKIIEFLTNLKNENNKVRSAEQRAADAKQWKDSELPT